MSLDQEFGATRPHRGSVGFRLKIATGPPKSGLPVALKKQGPRDFLKTKVYQSTGGLSWKRPLFGVPQKGNGKEALKVNHVESA